LDWTVAFFLSLNHTIATSSLQIYFYYAKKNENNVEHVDMAKLNDNMHWPNRGAENLKVPRSGPLHKT
jgi:hypothetical protein